MAVATACSSPGDVASRREDILRDNARVLADNEAAYRKAVEWNVRVLGLPASGALALLIVGICAIVAIVIAFFVYRYNKNADEITRLNKQDCPTCGTKWEQRKNAS